MKTKLLIGSSLIYLSACGGGGSDSGAEPAPSTQLSGLWSTTYAVSSAGNVSPEYPGYLLVSGSGEAVSVEYTPTVIYDALVLGGSNAGPYYTGITTDYAFNTGQGQSGILKITVTGRSLSGFYRPYGAQDQSLTGMAISTAQTIVPGTYNDADNSAGGGVSSVIISADGELHGNRTDGCSYSGSVSPISTAAPMLAVTLQLDSTSCGSTTQQKGLGVFVSGQWIFGVGDGTASTGGTFRIQS